MSLSLSLSWKPAFGRGRANMVITKPETISGYSVSVPVLKPPATASAAALPAPDAGSTVAAPLSQPKVPASILNQPQSA